MKWGKMTVATAKEKKQYLSVDGGSICLSVWHWHITTPKRRVSCLSKFDIA